MSNQTPPVVSDRQRAKWMQITGDCIRKGRLDGPTFQRILGHKDLAKCLASLFRELAAESNKSLWVGERPVSTTIRLGTFRTVEDLRQALLNDNFFCISNKASYIMTCPELALLTVPTEIGLCSATNTKLGFPDGCFVTDTFAAIEGIGGVKLPTEAGPQLRLQYLDQPLDEWCVMYMDAIPDSDGDPMIFTVGHNKAGRWLSTSYGSPRGFYGGDTRWVFGVH